MPTDWSVFFIHLRRCFSMVVPYVLMMLVLAATVAAAGTIGGTVKDAATGKPIDGVRVRILQLNKLTQTDANGAYIFRDIPIGNYAVQFSTPGWNTVTRNVTVADDVEGSLFIDMQQTKDREIIVYSAARSPQKITDAPAAISVVTSDQIQRAAPTGQVARTMENLPGVDVVQSGANDFNINTRGFNNSITRRTLVLIDGRDPSTPLINLNEWNSLSGIMDDVSSIEVVRGPGSALYGQNAYNGVINIRTAAPREVLGTQLTLGVGEWETYRANVRHAGELGNLSYKFTMGASTQLNYGLVSRQASVGAEYPDLQPALTAARAFDIPSRTITDKTRRPYQVATTLRFDYDLLDNSAVILEGGYTASGNEMYVNQTGRLLVQRVEKPFVRAAYQSERFTIQGLWQRRTTPDELPQLVYNANARSLENSDVAGLDAQYNNTLLDGSIRYIVGAQFDHQDVSSPTSINGVFQPDMTLISPERVSANFFGAYGQLEWKASEIVSLIGAARVDGSRLFPTQFSPKLGLVVTPVAGQSFRVTLNRSFLRPSYTELYRRSPAGAPVNFARTDSIVNSALRSRFGADVDTLNTGVVSQFNLGNPELEPEKALSLELGYRGSVTDRLLVTADVYYNRRTDFISAPLPGITQDIYPGYRVNLGNADVNRFADSVLAATLGAQYSRLSVYEGRPTNVIAPRNVAAIDEYGLEVSATYVLTPELSIIGNYAYFDFNVVSNEASAQRIVPNTSRHRANLTLDYTAPNLYDASVTVRWTDRFKWLAGAFEGTVPAYAVVNLSAGYFVTHDLRIGVNVFNVLDHAHYQIFGGTILRRQASLAATYRF